MKRGSISNFIAIMRYAQPYWGYLTVASFLNVITVGTDLGFLYLLKKLIDTGFASQDLPVLKWLSLGALGILLLRSAAGYASGYIINYIDGRMTNDIQGSIYEKIHELSLDFHVTHTTGDLLSIIFSHATSMLNVITSFSVSLVREMFRIPGLTLFLFSLHTQLALFAILVFPPVIFSTRLFSRFITKTVQYSYETLSDLYTTVEQTLPHIEIIKIFATESKEVERFKHLNNEMLKRSMNAFKASALSGPFNQLIKMVGVTVLVFLGTSKVVTGELSAGGLTTFLASAYYLYGGFSSIGAWYLSMLAGFVSAEKVFLLLRTKETVPIPSNRVTVSRFDKEVVFRDVTFNYPQEKKVVLKGINLCIRKGETLAIVGPSGSGKSTIVKLLLRLYAPIKGDILLDQWSLLDIDSISLRRLFGVAPQDHGIFQERIIEVIRYGTSDAKIEDIRRAAYTAGADDFISCLPQGYGTFIGERGVKLSGGEKQRISLARALLRNPEILVLDEALSSVDSSLEKNILQNIASDRKERTTILISHRMASIVHADRIIAIEDGELIEEGSHQELIAKAGRYSTWFLSNESEVY
ncbi:MAG: ABC transporter ATP-binding protein [Thermodesulfobacteriota bacterium]|nr:ABC transporter ATP-binding protein [Thermodesulfobacteriota bacterium]